MFTTIWRQRVKKRKGPSKGRTITEEKVYQTKSLTDLHAEICERYDGETWESGDLVYFCLDINPMVLGGKKINHAPSP